MSTVHSSILLLVLYLTASAEEESLRMYDLTDLLQPVVEFPAPALGIVVHGDSRAEPANQNIDTTLYFDRLIASSFTPQVMTLIRESSQLRGTTLLLTARPEVHAHVERTLARVRERQSLQVRVECVLALMDPRIRTSRYAFPGVAWKPITTHPGQFMAEQTPAEATVMLTALRGDRDVSIVSQPTLTVYAGQLAHAASRTQFAYLPLHLSERSHDPQVNVVNLGDVLELRATPTADRSLIAINLTHRRSSLLEQRVIQTGGRPAEEPIIWTGGEQVSQVMIPGHSLIIATGVYLDAKQPPQCGFLIVTPTLVMADDLPMSHPATPSAEPSRENKKAASQRE